MNHWLRNRIPGASEHKLSSQNIFILPSRFGLAFLLFVLLLLLMATNYQNNLIMLMAYLMASLFITAMLKSFFNLSGLIVKAQGVAYGHAQGELAFAVTLISEHKRYGLRLHFDDQEATTLDDCQAGKNTVKVIAQYPQRGRYQPGRLRISSEYGLGLFTTWTRLDFNSEAVVFPKPRPFTGAMHALSATDNQDEGRASYQPGMDEFYQLKNYVVGEPLGKVAWKHYAKGLGKMSKQYQQHQGDLNCLKLVDMPADNIEVKLQMLCFLIIEYANMGFAFGADLGEQQIGVNSGAEHKQHCLTALADFKGRY